MRIPPVSPTPHFHKNEADQAVNDFYELWTDWYQNNPTKENARKLLEFLDDHYRHFQELADKSPEAKEIFVQFEHAYDSAEQSIHNWIKAGCPQHIDQRTAASEYLDDIYKWIRYAR